MFSRKPKPPITVGLDIDSATRDRLRAAVARNVGEAASTHHCLTLTVNNRGHMGVATHLPAEQVAAVLRDAADQYAAQSGTFRESPEAERLAAILRLAAGRPGYHTITVKELLSAGITGDDASDGPGLPAAGQQYVSKADPAAFITVTRLWGADLAGVTYERPGNPSEVTIDLDLFYRRFQPAPTADEQGAGGEAQ